MVAFITNEIVVDETKDVLLATKPKDSYSGEISLHVAPFYGKDEDGFGLYVATNGNPVYLGALNNEGFCWVNDDPCNSDDPYCDEEIWIWCLSQFGFVGDSEEEAFAFLKNYTNFPI
jgi:hypothetical protein